MTITFYDIPSTLPGNAWSPNTYKARFALNFKGLPYQTEWVEYPDIETLAKKLGVLPTSKKADGRDHYTLPIIHDAATGTSVSDSFAIAEYLDATYPTAPRLFPSGIAPVALFNHHFEQSIMMPLAYICVPLSCLKLNPASQPYFRETREKRFGCAIEEVSPKGPKRDEYLVKVKAGLDALAGFLAKNGADKPYFFGDTLSYADIVLVAFLVWAVKIADDAELPELINSQNGGRWQELLKLTEKYQVVV